MDTHLIMNTQLSHAESEAHSAPRGSQVPPAPQRPAGRKAVIVLAICLALQMTSFVMVQPLFARRFSQLGAGVEALGASAMAYALAATLTAPFMGALADRFGRRLIVLGSLGVYILAFSGYLFASTASMFILFRGLAGAFTAGLMPAMIGIVADLAPGDRRAQWIGILTGGASVGWIAGPILGGALYDRWGYYLALAVSILLASATFIAAVLAVPETKKPVRKSKEKAGQKTAGFSFKRVKSSPPGFRNSFPKPLSTFILLLWITFAVMFAWAFIEPRTQFYAYDELAWTSSKLGLVMSTYGISMTLGEFGLSQLSDRLGRKPVILLGLMLFSVQFIGLAFFKNYLLIAATFLVAGLGNALFDPALSAAILDIGSPEHRARILGIKSTAGSLGNILGPGLIVLFTSWLSARGIFLIAAAVVLITILIMLTRKLIRQPSMNAPAADAIVIPAAELKQIDQGEVQP